MIWISMLTRNIAFSILILLLIGTASSQGTWELDGFTTGSGLTGQVVDVSGRGISGAKVWIIGGEGQAINTSTNATGRYGLNLPPGNYTITAELSGYSFTSSTAQVQAGTISIAQRITGYAAGTVPMAPITNVSPTAFNQYGLPYPQNVTGWVQGRIVDQSGTGIPSASIAVDGFRTSTVTDVQGNYRITLPPGWHRIDAVGSGYGIPPRVVFLHPGQTINLDIIGKKEVALGAAGRL